MTDMDFIDADSFYVSGWYSTELLFQMLFL